jgi:hypothetical protein
MSDLKKIKRPPVEIELDKKRTLKYTLYSFALMEAKYGSVDKAMEEMQKGRIATIIFMLYVGLIHEDKTLTEEYVGELVDVRDVEEVAAKMSEIMGVDMPEKNGENPNADSPVLSIVGK